MPGSIPTTPAYPRRFPRYLALILPEAARHDKMGAPHGPGIAPARRGNRSRHRNAERRADPSEMLRHHPRSENPMGRARPVGLRIARTVSRKPLASLPSIRLTADACPRLQITRNEGHGPPPQVAEARQGSSTNEAQSHLGDPRALGEFQPGNGVSGVQDRMVGEGGRRFVGAGTGGTIERAPPWTGNHSAAHPPLGNVQNFHCAIEILHGDTPWASSHRSQLLPTPGVDRETPSRASPRPRGFPRPKTHG